jgi:hypothetical protein
MLCHVALVRTDGSSEMLVLTRATLRNIPEDAILHSHRHENIKSYTKIDVLFTGNNFNILREQRLAGGKF